jgi:UDP-glucuronate decarboxylase
MDGNAIAFDMPQLPYATNRRKTVLVAGGAGFVGSHLCTWLMDHGDKVICLDNLQTGRASNIAPLMARDGFRFIRHDINDPFMIEGPIDQIYNLACAASPPLYQKDPLHTFRTCTQGVIALLTLAQEKGARILQASTSEVYGDPEISPQHEDYRGCVNTLGPRACYDEGKRAAETLFWEYGVHGGVQTRIARIFNTYGPRMSPDDGRVVSNFVVQALTGADITIYGEGRQTRSFCYVDDLIAGLTALMASDETRPVNIGNPVEFTVRELADQVLQQTASVSRLVARPLPVDDPRQRKPDISRAMGSLGWAPTITLADGLQRTIAHFAEELGLNQRVLALA